MTRTAPVARRLRRRGLGKNLRAGLLAALVGALAACGILNSPPLGDPSAGFSDARMTEAYIPLGTREMLLINRWGAAVAIAPHVAVTNAHNANLLPADLILGEARDYDLLFFRTDREVMPPILGTRVGRAVIGYGQGRDGSVREVHGTVTTLATPVAARCAECPEQRALTFDAQAGPGFSGGPLVDAQTGALIGVIFGYRDGEANDGGRRMFAYDIGLVRAEMVRLGIDAGL